MPWRGAGQKGRRGPRASWTAEDWTRVLLPEVEVVHAPATVLLGQHDLALLAALVDHVGRGVVAVHLHARDLGLVHLVELLAPDAQHQPHHLLAALLAGFSERALGDAVLVLLGEGATDLAGVPVGEAGVDRLHPALHRALVVAASAAGARAGGQGQGGAAHAQRAGQLGHGHLGGAPWVESGTEYAGCLSGGRPRPAPR